MDLKTQSFNKKAFDGDDVVIWKLCLASLFIISSEIPDNLIMSAISIETRMFASKP